MKQTRIIRVLNGVGLDSDSPVQFVGGAGGQALVLPTAIEASVEGAPWDAVVTLGYDRENAKVGVRQLVVTQRDGGPFLPSRGLQGFGLPGIVEDVLKAGSRCCARVDPDEQLPARAMNHRIEESDEPVSAATARLLATGRSKRPESIERDARMIVEAYHELRPTYTGSDFYSAIAERVGVGRSTVASRLREAGLVNRRDS